MNKQIAKQIENVTDSINHFLKNEQGDNSYQDLSTDLMLRSYINTVLPNNYKQAINLIKNQVLANNEVEDFTVALVTAFKDSDTPYCKLIWSEFDSYTDQYSDSEQAYCFKIVSRYMQTGIDIQTTMIVLFGVLSELINNNKHFYIFSDLADLMQEAKLVCLTQMLIELESIPVQSFAKAA